MLIGFFMRAVEHVLEFFAFGLSGLFSLHFFVNSQLSYNQTDRQTNKQSNTSSPCSSEWLHRNFSASTAVISHDQVFGCSLTLSNDLVSVCLPRTSRSIVPSVFQLSMLLVRLDCGNASPTDILASYITLQVVSVSDELCCILFIWLWWHSTNRIVEIESFMSATHA